MTISGTLAEAVCGRLDSGGNLVVADPLLMRLHLHCGGFEGGPLAIPQLASLCQLSKRLQMNLSRPISAGDDENLIDMWVETSPTEDGIAISIVDWNEKPLPAPREVIDIDRQRDFDRLNAIGQIRTDSALRIMAISFPRAVLTDNEYSGRRLLEILEIAQPSEQSYFVEAITERQPIREQTVRLNGDKKEIFKLSGQPLINRIGAFSGYQFSLVPLQSSTNDDISPDNENKGSLISNSLFGAQLGPALRQPLGKIIANAETIGAKLQGPLRGDYASYAKDIASAGRHLMDLVNDLSDLEAIERPNFKVAADDIDLIDLAHRAAGLLAVKASDHQIRIDLPSDDKKMPAQGEFRRVLQILVNLIGNAIRYSPDGSVIKVRVDQADGTAIISVADQGDGIAKEDQLKIFNKFERLGRSGDGGSGLGLFISNRLAKAMGGRLDVESKPGKGAKFILSLPLRTTN
ncbi:Two-component system sensor histidine kinase [hydrothermal vent metagenome]|uniref:histidine kinase n=1 Tax=hydrothermal vent metagenome TaxID=652676 RepID=A0A3B0SIB7_9ZZZZ